MSTQTDILAIQIEILKIAIQCSNAPQEYDADWRPDGGKVLRDQFGRFATRAGKTLDDAKALAKGTEQLLNISADAITKLAKDPGFRERAGLGASMLIGQMIGNLVAQSKILPGLSAEIDKMIAKQEKVLESLYGEDETALKQAFKNTSLPEPSKDTPLKDKMEFYVARYQAYEDALSDPKNLLDPKDLEGTVFGAITKITKATIPIAVGIGIALAADVAIPLLLGTQMSVGALAASSALSYGVSEVASLGTKKILEKTGLSDTQKMVIDIAVRILSASAVGWAASSFVRKYKSLAEISKKANKINGLFNDEAIEFWEDLVNKAEIQIPAKLKMWEKYGIKTRKKVSRILAAPTDPILEGSKTVKIVSNGQEVELLDEEYRAIRDYYMSSYKQNTLLRGSPSTVAGGEFGMSKELKTLKKIGGDPKKIKVLELEERFWAAGKITGYSDEEIVETIPGLIVNSTKGLKRLPVLRRKAPLIRSVTELPNLENLKPGDIFHEPAFTSVSLDPYNTVFNPKRFPVKLIIHPKNGVSLAKDISDMGTAGEGLYPPGMNFKVLEIRDVSTPATKQIEVYLQEAGISLL